MKLCATRVDNPFTIHDLLVLRLAHIGLAQVTDAFGFPIRNHDIFIAMRFFATAVVQCLFFRVFRTLAASVRAINDQIQRLTRSPLVTRKLVWIAYGANPHVLEWAL